MCHIMKTLIAYFSRKGNNYVGGNIVNLSVGNTEIAAKKIAALTGGDLYEIKPVHSYSEDYAACTEEAKQELRTDARPELSGTVPDLSSYDVIYLGYPIWWHSAPMVIGTFLESYDLSNIDIYPFSQSASMDTEQFEQSMDFIRDCAGDAVVHEGLFAGASDTEDITAWLAENDLIK